MTNKTDLIKWGKSKDIAGEALHHSGRYFLQVNVICHLDLNII